MTDMMLQPWSLGEPRESKISRLTALHKLYMVVADSPAARQKERVAVKKEIRALTDDLYPGLYPARMTDATQVRQEP